MPRHTDWARCTFEQGALSLLPELSAVMPAVVLPGPRLFQANRVDPQCMRPAVFHCFGRDKSGAKTTLRAMALEGWETLLAVFTWRRTPPSAMATNRMDSVWGDVLAWLRLRGHT